MAHERDVRTAAGSAWSRLGEASATAPRHRRRPQLPSRSPHHAPPLPATARRPLSPNHVLTRPAASKPGPLSKRPAASHETTPMGADHRAWDTPPRPHCLRGSAHRRPPSCCDFGPAAAGPQVSRGPPFAEAAQRCPLASCLFLPHARHTRAHLQRAHTCRWFLAPSRKPAPGAPGLPLLPSVPSCSASAGAAPPPQFRLPACGSSSTDPAVTRLSPGRTAGDAGGSQPFWGEGKHPAVSSPGAVPTVPGDRCPEDSWCIRSQRHLSVL